MPKISNKQKLLLHVCCACCSTEVIERLAGEYDITLFFSNSNIYPFDEYEKRLKSAKKLAKEMGLDLYEDEFQSIEWEMFVSDASESLKEKTAVATSHKLQATSLNNLETNYKKMPEGGGRCRLCFSFNLTRTAKFAKDFSFDCFTTTLTISPHKNHVMINEIGTILSKEYGVSFLQENFKKQDGFRKSIEHSKKHNLYRQNYCGCKYSMNSIEKEKF
ncbi:MAG: epoxyqueuosine reductase QueH [Candidatus Woesearchaeota archaeon]